MVGTPLPPALWALVTCPPPASLPVQAGSWPFGGQVPLAREQWAAPGGVGLLTGLPGMLLAFSVSSLSLLQDNKAINQDLSVFISILGVLS